MNLEGIMLSDKQPYRDKIYGITYMQKKKKMELIEQETRGWGMGEGEEEGGRYKSML